MTTHQQIDCVGVNFKPGGAFPFLRPRLTDLRNQLVSLQDCWGHEAALLREKLAEARSIAEKFHVLEAALLAQARDSLARHPAVRFALGQLPARIADLAKDSSLSQRRFIELFSREVGVTPKAYARVLRFQAVIERAQSEPDPDWTGLALDAGYYDQAHFIHEFRALSGFTPTQYLAHRGPHLNHVPL